MDIRSSEKPAKYDAVEFFKTLIGVAVLVRLKACGMHKSVAVILSCVLISFCAACGSGGGGSVAPITVPPTVNAISSVSVAPATITLAPGESRQFSASVSGTGSYATTVKWTVNDIANGNTVVGTVSDSGLYATPYPSPVSVTIKAVSTADPTKVGSATITLAAPAVAAGPELTVDAAVETHKISPFIYGMNFWSQDTAVAKAARIGIDRWGGNATTPYNYKLDISNNGGDWFFEVLPNTNSAYPDVSDFNTQVTHDAGAGTKTMGSVPVTGWTVKSRTKACSFSVAKYGVQQKTDPYWSDCGNGVKLDGTAVVSDPTDTSMPIDERWAGDWVKYLVGKFGDAAGGGVAVYSLDNEPSWWDANHKDVHPLPFTYDEVTQNGLKVAAAVKAADPTAEVSGPVIDYWPNYFYSMKDLRTGWATGPNYVFNGNPVDRKAHGNVPMLEYYLQKFKAAQDADPAHQRLLDYLDLHTYFVANSGAFTAAGTADQQRVMIDSTRVMWDATYTDSNYTDPDDTSAKPKPLAPQMIRRMQKWVDDNYPGTKLAITEYNWGAQEHISGAVAQADLLGIFGREGLDLGTLWGPPDPVKQRPGLMAFMMFRNYDGANGEFGDMALSSSSADSNKIAVYAARRTADAAITVIVINKSFGDLKSDVQVANFSATAAAKVYRYSNVDLTSIKNLSDATVTLPTAGSTTSVIKDVTFPAMSITLFEVR
jgi:hypothetical protein